MGNNEKIVIVGAGPVGLCTALSLTQAGIPVTILDAKPGLSGVGSKAIVLDHGSLLHFEAIGCLDEILNQGLVPKRRRTFSGGQQIAVHEFTPPLTDIPLFANLPQSRTEQILLDQLMATGLADIRWGVHCNCHHAGEP